MKKDFFEEGQYYHIYNRGNNKENIFIEEKNYRYFLEKMKKYILPIADVYSYCLLKNHFHIVLRIKDKVDLPEKLKEKIHLPFSNLFNSYSKSINKAYNRTGSLFQEHLQRNRIENEDYLKQLIIYVHLNPVKHKFSERFETYLHSSYRSFLSDKLTSIDRDFIVNLFGGLENFKFCHDERRLLYEGVINDINLSDE
ncbi:transposase IS200 family protein [Flavobacterium sp. 90]|uniref:transposase n=1 Tax=unclassified Flavobacterium TaxID=196869 RepID=UPI000EB1B7DF|nr:MULTISPECIES: transposase [unclassified Flavobacterium]RKR09632.1 transposase IS200 family protein [Flavobacterium sp. 81]TCK53416.1 transposase IS200 family protein [Flavobacterium sp. 90]